MNGEMETMELEEEVGREDGEKEGALGIEML